MAPTTKFLFSPHPTVEGKDTYAVVSMFLGQGSDVIWFGCAPGTPVDGVAGTGTGAGFAGIGSMFIDTTAGNLYINGGAGTKLSPVWKLVTKAA